MNYEELREGVARLLCKQLGDKWEDMAEMPGGMFVSQKELLDEADPILSLIREEIKGIENPYPDTMGSRVSHKVFRESVGTIIEALGGE